MSVHPPWARTGSGLAVGLALASGTWVEMTLATCRQEHEVPCTAVSLLLPCLRTVCLRAGHSLTAGPVEQNHSCPVR